MEVKEIRPGTERPILVQHKILGIKHYLKLDEVFLKGDEGRRRLIARLDHAELSC